MDLRLDTRIQNGGLESLGVEDLLGEEGPSAPKVPIGGSAELPTAPPRDLEAGGVGAPSVGASSETTAPRAEPGSLRSNLALSRGAYAQDPAEIAQAVDAAGYDHYRVVEGGGERALVAGKEGQPVAVAVRGSDNVENWLSNLDVRQTDAGTHNGFEDGVQSLRQAGLDQAIVDMKRETHADSVTLTGHSRGGAMATLLASQYDQENHKVDHVTTFGSPAAGNDEFAQDYDRRLGGKTTAVVNDDDLVPGLLGPELGYQRSAGGEHVTLGGAGGSGGGELLDGGVLDGLWDHGMDEYARGLG